MAGIMDQFVNIAGLGIALGGSMGGIVIAVDYVLTSILSMMKGR